VICRPVQFVLHYDVAGYAKRTFQILQDERDLSIHFVSHLLRSLLSLVVRIIR
jgi:hypothetical protein